MLHIGIAHMLTGAKTTTFGNYNNEFTTTPAASSAAALATDLADAEQQIAERNTKRPRPYPYLAPSAIPNSIEI